MGHALEVKDTCEKAVEFDPNNGERTDSRGLNRALLGDFEGAILDFQSFVNEQTMIGNGQSDTMKQRQQWISDLKSGKNPFTPDVLELLKSQ